MFFNINICAFVQQCNYIIFSKKHPKLLQMNEFSLNAKSVELQMYTEN